MRHTLENNFRFYDQEYSWLKDGDEWDGQARFCGKPYAEWKASLIEALVIPNVSSRSVVLEIGPGHGRWSRELAGLCGDLILVDVSPSCIRYCKGLLGSRPHVKFIVNDGLSLAGVADDEVDFIWSYESFTQWDKQTIGRYLAEIRRVLKPAGKAIIHHAGRAHGFLWLGFLMYWGNAGRETYKVLSMRKLGDTDGWRSNISRRSFAALATANGLTVSAQVQAWGAGEEYGVPRFGDYLTHLTK